MGVKRINKQQAQVHHGNSIALWRGERKKNTQKNENWNAVYYINNMHAHKENKFNQCYLRYVLRTVLLKKEAAENTTTAQKCMMPH